MTRDRLRSAKFKVHSSSLKIMNELNPSTVDAIIEREDQLLLIRRKHDPFAGMYALPGGFVDYGETVEKAVIREVQEECNVKADPKTILGVYSGQERDPRGPVISTVFICRAEGNPEAGDDAATVHWIDMRHITEIELAFDHRSIIKDYRQWKQNRSETFWTSKNIQYHDNRRKNRR